MYLKDGPTIDVFKVRMREYVNRRAVFQLSTTTNPLGLHSNLVLLTEDTSVPTSQAQDRGRRTNTTESKK
jgi:hypothetical protein